MLLKEAQVFGFQSYSDSGIVYFFSGINLIIGQNNAGKSSFLRALQPSITDDRHRTPDRWEDFHVGHPHTKMTISFNTGELKDEILAQGAAWIPIPLDVNPQLYVDKFISFEEHVFKVDLHVNGSFTSQYPSHALFVQDPRAQARSTQTSNVDGSIKVISEANITNDNLPTIVYQAWSKRMFYFSAERMNIGQYPSLSVSRLNPSADNLPAVLFTLQGERGDIFAKLVRHLRDIFPTVGNLSVRPLGANTVEIRVWPTEAMRRVELSFPLAQSGTGVSQVISILTAVMTLEHAVIIIDEINSFLHPSAVKSLLRILNSDYSSHQYIITTHSPDVISSSNPKSIYLVRREGYESSISRLDLDAVVSLREVGEHLGVSMADVFAADRVIWVEGPTEELCFPLLYEHASGSALPRGTKFISVLATGDFLTKRRDRELVYQIYKRLSEAAAPLVVSCAFSFDSEALSDADKSKMVVDSRGSMNFLPRRLIECYLVNARAIFRFIIDKDPQSITGIDEVKVETHLKSVAASDKFWIPEYTDDLNNESWLAKVDAAKLIAQVCIDLSESRASFAKKDDTLLLLRLTLEDNSQQVSELANYVHTLVQKLSPSATRAFV